MDSVQIIRCRCIKMLILLWGIQQYNKLLHICGIWPATIYSITTRCHLAHTTYSASYSIIALHPAKLKQLPKLLLVFQKTYDENSTSMKSLQMILKIQSHRRESTSHPSTSNQNTNLTTLLRRLRMHYLLSKLL